MTTAHEIRKYGDDQLKGDLVALRRKLFEMRSQSVTEKIEDVSQFRKVRRDIARLMTEIRARAQNRQATK